MIGGNRPIYPPRARYKIFVRELRESHSFRRKENLPLFDFEIRENLKKKGEYG